MRGGTTMRNAEKDRAIKLVLSQEYITWLQNFIYTHPSFSNDEWRYFPEQAEPENLEMVEKLPYFVEGIKLCTEKRAHRHDQFGYSIKIMFNNVGYRVGQQGTERYFCEGVEIFLNEKFFIDFNHIMENAKMQ